MDWKKATERVMAHMNTPEEMMDEHAELTVKLADEISDLLLGAPQLLTPIIVAALDTTREPLLAAAGDKRELFEGIAGILCNAIESKVTVGGEDDE